MVLIRTYPLPPQGAVGFLVSVQYTKIDNGEVTLKGQEEYEAASQACFGGVGFYALCLLGCLIRVIFLRVTRSSVEIVR